MDSTSQFMAMNHSFYVLPHFLAALLLSVLFPFSLLASLGNLQLLLNFYRMLHLGSKLLFLIFILGVLCFMVTDKLWQGPYIRSLGIYFFPRPE